MFHVDRRLNGSIPEVGSSKKTTFASPIRAIQSESLRFMPPDSSPAFVNVFSVSPTSAIFSLTQVAGSRPFSLAKIFRCSPTVRLGHRISCCARRNTHQEDTYRVPQNSAREVSLHTCGQTPIVFRIKFISVLIDRPRILASPREGVSIPVSMWIVVVLPVSNCESTAS